MHVSGGDYETISMNGTSVSARHFTVMGDNREDVWLDNQGHPGHVPHRRGRHADRFRAAEPDGGDRRQHSRLREAPRAGSARGRRQVSHRPAGAAV